MHMGIGNSASQPLSWTAVQVSKSKANENVCCPGGVNVGDEEAKACPTSRVMSVPECCQVSRVSWQEYYKCRERITETNHINKARAGVY